MFLCRRCFSIFFAVSPTIMTLYCFFSLLKLSKIKNDAKVVLGKKMMVVYNSRKCCYRITVKFRQKSSLFVKDQTTCALCKENLMNNCPDCKKVLFLNENEVKSYLDLMSPHPSHLRSKDGEKRNQFDRLPKDLLSMIVDRVPMSYILFYVNCPISVGECGHTFHVHCINKWLLRGRLVCPLDYDRWSTKIIDHLVFTDIEAIN